jgi:uncharacterized protein YgbK (DUF1537 family)
MPLLGCIADDVTGATDLASMLVSNGMRTVLVLGVPEPGRALPDTDAVVVALKSRTAPVAAAVADSLAALAALRAAGAESILFKYCSTFDSTPAGNIGPVTDALADALGEPIAIACPAFPANGRTVYQGHLFVGSKLLDESGMENHPLTPMRDSDVVRLLAAQTPHAVGLVPRATVAAGPEAIAAALADLAAAGRRHAVVDAICDDDLRTLGFVAAERRLVTGGSGIAMGLPEAFRRRGRLASLGEAAAAPAVAGRAAILVGSCSRATRRQVAAGRDRFATLILDPIATPAVEPLLAAARAWLADRRREETVMIVGSAEPEAVARLQAILGVEAAGELIETVLSTLAVDLVGAGVRRLIVAGGETSGAVVRALGARELAVGREIAPGVPWTVARRPEGRLGLALKSGNFGGDEFFADALAACETGDPA